MEMHSLLANVIKQVRKEETRGFVNTASRRLVVIDRKNGTAVDNKPMFGTFDYYIVYNSSDPNHCATARINSYTMTDFATGLKLSLDIEYRVTCPSENEARVAQAFFNLDGNTPGKMFEDSIIRHIDRAWESIPLQMQGGESKLEAFCRDGAGNLTWIRKEVETALVQEKGLNVHLRFALSGEEKLMPLEWSGALSVMMTDSEENFDITYRIQAALEPVTKFLALLQLSTQYQLEDRMKDLIKHWMRREVRLEQLVYEFDTMLHPLLRNELNEMFKKSGRQVEYLSVKTVKNLKMPEDVSTECDVTIKVPRRDNIVIKNALKVEPDHSKISLFRRAGIIDKVDLTNRLQNSLETIVAKTMFGKSYMDILLRFNKIQKEIEGAMTRTAEALGYHIRLIISTPDLEPLVWQNPGFELETQDRVEFATNIDQVRVKINVIVKGKIPDLSKIESYLVANQDVMGVLRDRIVDYLALELHRTDPQNYYSNFEFAMNGGESLKEKFQKQIAEILRKEFGVSDISVVAKSLQTDVTDRINDLQKVMGKFSIGINSFQDMLVPITLSGQFRILGVVPEQWHIFHIRNHTIEEIQTFLTAALKHEIETLQTDMLAYISSQHRRRLSDWLDSRAKEIVKKEFGLMIEVSFVGREATEFEEQWAVAQQRQRLDNAAQIAADMDNAAIIAGKKAERMMISIKNKEEELATIREHIRKLRIDPDDTERETLEEQAKHLEKEIADRIQQLSDEHLPKKRNVSSLAPPYHASGVPNFHEGLALVAAPEAPKGAQHSDKDDMNAYTIPADETIIYHTADKE